MGKELVDILLKKKMAISSKLLRNKKSLDSHIERVNAINLRYKVLRDKLEAEWREELASLEEDRLTSFRNHKDLEGQLLEIDDKLEKYRIEDKNLKEDRWALDPRLYFSK
jgi:chromosome segregation ATPase